MGKRLENRAFKTYVERALFCNLNSSHCSQGAGIASLDPLVQSQTCKSVC